MHPPRRRKTVYLVVFIIIYFVTLLHCVVISGEQISTVIPDDVTLANNDTAVDIGAYPETDSNTTFPSTTIENDSETNVEKKCTPTNDSSDDGQCASSSTTVAVSLSTIGTLLWPNSVILSNGRLGLATDELGHQGRSQLGTRDGNDLEYCRRPARCTPLNRTSCYGTTLPYKYTSLDLINVNESDDNLIDIEQHLDFWQRLQNFPKCWTVVQSLLCAVFVPRCEDGQVDLPSLEMCRVVQGPCRIMESTLQWPRFLQCDYEKNFQRKLCKAEARELRFNLTSFCQPPLIAVDAASNWYDGFEGCGLHCHNPFFSKQEHSEVHTFVGILGTACLTCSLFTVVTFFIDWKNANKYPALIIFYINWCFLILSIGWLAQFTPGARDDIVCRQDGTLRKYEPSSGENLSCVIVFIMVYYFLMAAAAWFVMLTYSWYISFKVLGKIRETIEANAAYFHLISWSFPLVLTITILALGQVDGDSISGICFVGHFNPYIRVAFVLLPICVTLGIGSFYLTRGKCVPLFTIFSPGKLDLLVNVSCLILPHAIVKIFNGLIVLIRIKIGSDDIISAKASSKIRNTIIRLSGFAVLSLTFVAVSVICHIHEYANHDDWNVALRRYIICKSNMTKMNPGQCSFESRPTVAMIQLHLSVLFCAGIMMSSWIWTPSTVDAWKRFARRAFHQPINEPVKLTKHKMIAKAFAKRHQIRGNRVSFSFQSIHDDPLGMNFDLNSAASHDVSSTWQAALPKFITRRGAFMGAGALGLRRNSSASEVSQRRHSIDSRCTRRLSLDSQISFRMSDRERMAYMALARQQRRKKKRRHRATGGSSRVVPRTDNVWASEHRRGSTASQQSDFASSIPQLLAAMKVNNIEKEAAKRLSEKPSRSNRFLPSVFNRGKVSGKSKKSSSGWRNLGFIRGMDSSSDDEAKKMVRTSLPGQIGTELERDAAIDLQRDGTSRSLFRSQREVPLDARSVISTDNESLHKLGEQLSNTILVRAIRDSQSDLEMGVLNDRHNGSSKCLGNSSRDLDTCLNNAVRLGRSTVVDLETDSDTRESSSS